MPKEAVKAYTLSVAQQLQTMFWSRTELQILGQLGFSKHHPNYFFGDDEMFVEDKDGAHMKSRIQRNGIGRPAEVDALVLPVFDTPLRL